MTHPLDRPVWSALTGRQAYLALGDERALRFDPAFALFSGVCTHPDFRGRGYAGTLMRVVTGRILERGEQAFLHAYADRAATIALYETLGFRVRTPVTYTVLDGPG